MSSRAWTVLACVASLVGCGVSEGPGPEEITGPGGKADGVRNGAGAAVHCWAPGNVAVNFNATLDARLEAPAEPGVLGGAADRQVQFQAAVDAWNTELTAVGAGVQLVLNNQGASFASEHDLAQFVCTEQANNLNVYKPSYVNNPANPSGVDGTNSASTAYSKNPMSGPGWVASDEVMSIATDRLAETLSTINADNVHIDEGDITWMTHESAVCGVLPWAYDQALLTNRHFDFYSVMLHELGHFLGLGHLDDQSGTNAMLATISEGTIFNIGPMETAELQARYAPGGVCPPNAVVPPPGGGQCGLEGEACCDDGACSAPLSCADGLCVAQQSEPTSCGSLYEACCDGGTCNEGLYCDEYGSCAE